MGEVLRAFRTLGREMHPKAIKGAGKMKVKELITRLLEEDMNAEVFVATTDESRKDQNSTERNNVCFDITEVEHWGCDAYIGFTDWRSEDKE